MQLKLFTLAIALAVCAQAMPVKQAQLLHDVAPTPPMGWRSWNCFLMNVNEDNILAQAKAMSSALPSGDSLLSLGYSRVGIDDGWQECGAGVNGTFHTASGQPIVNTTRFPDMKAMNAKAHAMGIKMGWYMNNCGCCERGHEPEGGHPTQDSIAVADADFDGVKVDGCGPAHDIHVWSKALVATGRPILLENCGDNHDSWSPPLPSELETCDFHLYRISSDIAPQFHSTMYNLQHQIPFQDPSNPMSRPNCWAYPDMLQVGNRLSLVESRTHFSAWCITSAPLILGFDLSDAALLAQVAPIIGNKRAIQINQDWAGHPGRLVLNSTSTFTAPVAHGAGCDCCDDTSKCDKYTFPTWQVWMKPQPMDLIAVLIINLSDSPVDVSVPMKVLGISPTAPVETLDVWTGADQHVTGSLEYKGIAPHDSVFITIAE